MNSNLPHEGNSLENSDGYTDPNEQLPSADLATRRGFLRRSGSAGVAVGLFALAPLAHSDEGSGSGSVLRQTMKPPEVVRQPQRMPLEQNTKPR